MRFLQRALLFLFSVCLAACSCGGGSRSGTVRIGIDPYWYPIDFGSQQAYVNGFTEELLLEIARYTGIEFERIPANWDNLFDGMKTKRYDAVISSLPPYDFNKALFDFSSNFLDLGPVLIVPAGAQHADLEKMGGELVGIVSGDPAVLVLNQYPDIVLRKYSSIPDLLNAIENGEIEAGLLDRIPAAAYVQDLYHGKLKIGSGPMTHAGLHLVTLKGRNEHLLNQFNKALSQMEKKKKLEALLKKWQLNG